MLGADGAFFAEYMVSGKRTTGEDKPSPPIQAREPRPENPPSSYGSVPGSELPLALYVCVFVAFAWVLLASWLAFAGDGDAELALGMASVLAVVFFALPVLVFLTARSHSSAAGHETKSNMVTRRVEIATGTLDRASAWMQVLLIPWTLALAATLIGATYLLVH